MRKISSLFAVLAMSGTALFAQDTGNTEATSDAGEVQAEAAPEIGQLYIKETTGDWNIRCARTSIGQPEPCDMFQVLNNAEGTPVAEIMVQTVNIQPEAAANLIVAAPLGVFLPAGVKIAIDGRDVGGIPFIVCNTKSCVARATLKETDVQAFKAGNVAQITIVPAENPRAPVAVNSSLAGFTAGFDQLPKSN